MNPAAANPAPVPTGQPAPAACADPIEAVDLLGDKLARLRDACGKHAQAEEDLQKRLLALAARERDLDALSAAARAREQAATARQAAAEAALKSAAAREKAAADRLAELNQREADLHRQDDALAKARESLHAREEELLRVKERLEGLRRALKSLDPAAAASLSSTRPDDLEGLIASTVRRAVDSQVQTDQISARLRAAEDLAAAHDQRAAAAERRASELETGRRALEESLRESQALCARIEATADAAIAELRAEIKRLTRDRSAIQDRLDRQTRQLERAGLQIEWTPDEPAESRPKPKPRKRSA